VIETPPPPLGWLPLPIPQVEEVAEVALFDSWLATPLLVWEAKSIHWKRSPPNSWSILRFVSIRFVSFRFDGAK
jgi:hypothetical protein